MDCDEFIFFEVLDMLLWGYDKITENLTSLWSWKKNTIPLEIELKTMTTRRNKKCVKTMKKMNLHDKINLMVDKMEKIEEE